MPSVPETLRRPLRCMPPHVIAGPLVRHTGCRYACSAVTKSSNAAPMRTEPCNDAPYRLLRDVRLGADVVVHAFTNLYGCSIGDRTRIGPFVEIQSGVRIGADCKIQSHTFICDGVVIEEQAFIGHGVLFVNDKRPR